MATIQDYLNQIKNAIYGKDVRQAIHDGIQQCYYDGKAGSTDLEARQRLDFAEGTINSLGSRMSTAETDIDVLDARVDQIIAPSGEAPSAAEVADARVGDDNVTYGTLGDAIRTQFANVKKDTWDNQKYPNMFLCQYVNHKRGTIGKYHKHAILDWRSSPSSGILDYLIPVYKGITYSYDHVYAYFTNILYKDGTIVALSESTSNRSGTFTPEDDGLLYVTLDYVPSTLSLDEKASIVNDTSIPSTKIIGFYDKSIPYDLLPYLEQIINQVELSWLPEDSSEYTFGQYYQHGALNTSNGPACTLPPIKLIGGVTYQYSHIYAYFCNFVDSETGVISALSSSTSGNASGEFTPPHDGLLYVTLAASGSSLLYDSTLITNPSADGVVEVSPTSDVIEMLKNNAGRRIHFGEGTYDIISIYKSKYGNSFFDNYAGYSGQSDVFLRGLNVGRDTEVTFSSGAVFVANYTGNNSAVRSNFAAFALESGAVLDGLNLRASGIRNCIHDDFDNTYSAKTIIKNCHLEADTNIIAGGLAIYDSVIIENCIFKNTNPNHSFDISYHNNSSSSAQSTLVIRDNYFHKGVSIRWYGLSTKLSDVMINNNSMANQIEKRAENASATIDNINLVEWNNELRS